MSFGEPEDLTVDQPLGEWHVRPARIFGAWI